MVEIKCAHTELVDIDKLIPNPKNPNKHPDNQIELLSKIIRQQGMRAPVVVSKRSGFITKGHGRLEALKRIEGVRDVPVDYQDYENEAMEYADMVADNKIAELAKTDLSQVIDDVKLLDLPDLDLLGIPDFELPEEIEPQCDEDHVPEVVDTRSKPGDVWQLGNHRLMCGDSTDVLAVEKLMNGEKADMVFTDPPYNVNYGKDNSSNTGGWSNVDRPIQNDHMSSEDYLKFSMDIAASITIMTDGCVYVCAAPGKDGRIMFRAMDDSLHCSTTIIWNKDSMVMGRGKYHNKYEPIWFGWVESGKQFTDNRKLVNVWDFNRPKRSDLHPTMKPVELIENAINHASNDSVADLFGGSGSTLIACEKTNRKCYMMELDPHYCDVILSRWEKYTGKEAVCLEEGQLNTNLSTASS